MNHKVILFLLAASILTCFQLAQAQQPKKIPRIGYVSGSGDANNPGPYVEAFRQGLRDLGYIEGKNVLVEYRYAEGKLDRTASLAAELVQLKVDVVVVAALPGILAAKQATKTIPVVMVTSVDPVATGLIDSLGRPGGNITGLSRLTGELRGNGWNCLRRWSRECHALESLWIRTRQGWRLLLKITRLRRAL
jgi:putative tryptophan/tyrosine transport system substrate-binding protein